MSFIPSGPCRVDPVSSIYKFRTTIDVLRLDLLHPVISGNKWFKLRYYLEEAGRSGKKTLLSFGGPYSNHILATAAAAKESGFLSIGIIRGEAPSVYSPTLKDAAAYGMELIFVPRDAYRQKEIPLTDDKLKEVFIIPEGGYGELGVKGAKEILAQTEYKNYTHIVAAVGTGTMIAGVLNSALPHQSILGISVLKNNLTVDAQIKTFLSSPDYPLHIHHDYHFGGYAKYTSGLIQFMNEWFIQTGIPSDFVYTGKLFYAVNELVLSNYFPAESRLLVIHSGGLQGNRSLSKGTLIF